MFMFVVSVTAEGAEGGIAHLDAFWEGSGSENLPDLGLSLLHTGTILPYPFQFVTHKSWCIFVVVFCVLLLVV